MCIRDSKKGVRSFWLNAFSSPWTPWEKIVLKFLDAKDDPQRLKVVYNGVHGLEKALSQKERTPLL